MMKLVARLEKHADLFEGDEGALMREAASAIEEMCEHLDECWTKYEAAVAAEREACAKILEAHADELKDCKARLERHPNPHYLDLEQADSYRKVAEIIEDLVAAIRARNPSPQENNG